MAGIKLANGTAASAEMTVDTNGNAHVVLPTDIEQAGHAALASEIDDGTVTGSRILRALELTDDYRVRVGLDSILFNHSFEGTNIMRDRFTQADTASMTAAQTNGQLTINSTSLTTSGAACTVTTRRTFPLFGSYTTYAEMWVALSNQAATNTVTEWGLGFVTGVVATPTDGILFRVTSGGTLRAVVNNNGADRNAEDITTTNIPSRDNSGAFDISEVNHYIIAVHNDDVMFWINNVLVKKFHVVSTDGSPSSASNLPMFFRNYNSAVASAARQLQVKYINVSLGEVGASRPWSHQLCGSGGGAYQIQPGTASGPNVTRGASGTAGWPNSAQARAAGTWTATTAPAINSLGGQWVSPAISTLTSEADYPVFSYLNPAATATLPGKTLYITRVRWGNTVAAAAASTNSINLQYIIGVGGTSSATTQTEGALIVASRGTVVDTIPFKSTAAIGDYVPGGSIDFSNGPLVVNPGQYIQWVVRPYGTVTSNTLVVHGSVAFVGYYE